MGHERVGFLPKTKRWNDLVRQMASDSLSELPVSSVTAQVLQNVRKRYETLFRDDAVRTIFTFLVAVSRACRYDDPQTQLRESGIALPDQPTLLSIVKALHQQVPVQDASTEYGQLALSAAADAIGQWHKQHSNQLPLFQPSNELFESWRNLGKGAGFCELSRLYFGKLTERYLNYFLDRAASQVFSDIQKRESFQRKIQSHIDDVSKHAFETAKITQSFAAGWFNVHAQNKMPDVKEIDGFLSLAFGKLRDELRREGEKQ